MQGPRGLPLVQRQADGRDRGPSGGPRHSPRARPPIRALRSQAPPALPPSPATDRQRRPSHPAPGSPGQLEGSLSHRPNRRLIQRRELPLLTVISSPRKSSVLCAQGRKDVSPHGFAPASQRDTLSIVNDSQVRRVRSRRPRARSGRRLRSEPGRLTSRAPRLRRRRARNVQAAPPTPRNPTHLPFPTPPIRPVHTPTVGSRAHRVLGLTLPLGRSVASPMQPCQRAARPGRQTTTATVCRANVPMCRYGASPRHAATASAGKLRRFPSPLACHLYSIKRIRRGPIVDTTCLEFPVPEPFSVAWSTHR